MKVTLVLICALFILASGSFAQVSNAYQTVIVNLNSGVITSPLPFHEPFLFQGKIDKEVMIIKAKILLEDCGNLVFGGEWKRNAGIPAEDLFYIFCDKPLEANEEYIISFNIIRKLSEPELAVFRSNLTANYKAKLQSEDGNGFCSNDSKAISDNLDSLQSIIRKSLIIDQELGEIYWPNEGLLKDDKSVNTINDVEAFKIEAREEFPSYCTRVGCLDKLKNNCDKLEQDLSQLAVNNSIDLLYAYFNKDLQIGKWDIAALRTNAGILHRLKNADGPVRKNISKGTEMIPGSTTTTLNTNPNKEYKHLWDQPTLEDRLKTIEGTRTQLSTLKYFIDQLSIYKDEDLNFKKLNIDLNTLKAEISLASSDALDVKGQVGEIRDLLKELDKEIESFVNKISDRVELTVYVRGTTDDKEIKTRSMSYVGVDFGLAYSPLLKSNTVVPFYGINFYLSPVNKRVKLRENLKDDPVNLENYSATRFARSFSISVGLTLYGINLEGERNGLVNDLGLMAGAGWRINRVMRVSCGAIMFNKKDPEPLSTDYSFGATGYIALSADIDFFGAMGDLIKKAVPNY